MKLRSLGRVVAAFLLIVVISGATFSAQQAQPYRTLTFAELTVGAAINAMAPDGHGGTWFGGQTCSTSLPTTADAAQRTMTSGCHGMLGRMNADGAIVYLTYLGGTQGGDNVLALAVDAGGNVVAAGSTTSPDFPTTAGAYDRACGNDGTCTIYRYAGFAGRYMTLTVADGFVTVVNGDGSHILFSTYIGGSDDDAVTGVAVDNSGQIHVTGRTISTDFPVTGGALQTAWSPDYDPDDDPLTDAFYARISADHTVLAYGTYLGGTGSDWGTGVTVDAQGDAYVTGNTTATNFPTLNAARPVHSSDTQYPNTSADGFLVRFAPGGARYSTYVGGSSSDYANAIAVAGGSAFLAGEVCSPDFPGVSDPNVTQCEAYVADLDASTGAVTRAVTLHNSGGWDRALALAVDANLHAYVTGLTVSFTAAAFPTTPDAYQRSTTPSNASGNDDAFLSIVDMSAETPSLLYSTYLGGTNEEQGYAVAPDGSGGAFFGGYSRVISGSSTFPSHTSQPQPPAEGTTQSFAAHVAVAPSAANTADVVLYARNASTVAGAWQIVADSTAAGGARIWNPDAGAAKLASAAPSPANYFELTFDAQAGVPYHLWLRMKADTDSWQNDSVFVQFSDSVDGSGNPVWRTGTTGATVISLEDCSGCGEQGWGWNDNGYNTAGTPVVFATAGPHTIRIQQREDGVSIDQIVLSPSTYLNAAPGANKNDTTIIAATPSPSVNEAVIYAGDATGPMGAWQLVTDATAAGGTRLWNPDAGVAKLASASPAPANYVDITFNAQAGVSYHLWLRMKADNDSWQNDSVFVQFSDSVDGSGNPLWRMGSTSATVVSLEDCSGCGEQAWGWNDNGYNTAGTPVVFATTGTHTIRIQQREDGISIDQIVLSAVKYATAAPGAAKNDTTIVSR